MDRNFLGITFSGPNGCGLSSCCLNCKQVQVCMCFSVCVCVTLICSHVQLGADTKPAPGEVRAAVGFASLLHTNTH